MIIYSHVKDNRRLSYDAKYILVRVGFEEIDRWTYVNPDHPGLVINLLASDWATALEKAVEIVTGATIKDIPNLETVEDLPVLGLDE